MWFLTCVWGRVIEKMGLTSPDVAMQNWGELRVGNNKKVSEEPN